MGTNKIELVKRVAKAGPDTWENIRFAIKEQGRKMPEVAKEMFNLSKEPYLKKMPEKQRLQLIGKIFYSRLLKGFLTPANPHVIHVLDKTAPREVKTEKGLSKVSNVYGVGARIDEKGKPQEVAFTAITLWGDKAEAVKDLEVGENYEALLSGKKRGAAYSLGSTEKTSWEEFEGKAPKALKTPKAVLRKSFPLVNIGDLYAASEEERKSFISKPRSGDFKLVRGDVVSSYTRPTKTGDRNYGKMLVTDDSISAEDFKEKGGLSVLMDPTLDRWQGGSILYIIGEIRYSEQYGWGMDAKLIIPEVGIDRPKEKKMKKAKKVEVDDEDAEVVDFLEED